MKLRIKINIGCFKSIFRIVGTIDSSEDFKCEIWFKKKISMRTSDKM